MTGSLKFRTAEIAEYISWSYFFHAWGFPAKFAAVVKIHDCDACISSWIAGFDTPEDRERAKEVVSLYRDARKVLSDCDGRYSFRCLFAVFGAESEGDDIWVSADDGRIMRIPCLRQQYQPQPDGTCLCLADYIRPREKGGNDRIGVFVSSNDGRMEEQHPEDNYLHMLYQTLSDRLCEAGTEAAHALIRRKYWGYAPDEDLTVDDLIMERYRGIRPAVGYPPLPDQSVIFILNDLIDFSRIGVSVTEIGAMRPHSSACGLMFAHPKAKYFNVGKIGMDQAEDYAKRRGLSIEIIKKYLRRNIVIQ